MQESIYERYYNIPLIVHPVTIVHVPEASQETVVGLAVPSYPVAQDTDDVPWYVVAVVPVNEYPVSDGVPQSDIKKQIRKYILYVITYSSYAR